MKKQAPLRAGSVVLALGAVVACWLVFTESANNLAIFAMIACSYTLWRLEKLEKVLESNRHPAETSLENSPALLAFPPVAPPPLAKDQETETIRVA